MDNFIHITFILVALSWESSYYSWYIASLLWTHQLKKNRLLCWTNVAWENS